MKKNDGLLVAASFSHGCQTAEIIGIDPILKKYVRSEGKSCGNDEMRKLLSKLVPYFCYRIISLANGIEDPFNILVVKAYWIGNELLEKVKPIHIGQTLKEFEQKGRDIIPLVMATKPILKGKYPCHNSHVRDFSCAVTLQDGYFWHIKERRIKATQKDIKNFQKYGKG